MLTDKGYENILDILNGRCELNVTKEFINEHYATFCKHFPAADDAEYVCDYPDTEAWWTFDAECNDGGINDTYQREQLSSVAAEILFGMPWPCYGDTPEVHEKFEAKLAERKLNTI